MGSEPGCCPPWPFLPGRYCRNRVRTVTRGLQAALTERGQKTGGFAAGCSLNLFGKVLHVRYDRFGLRIRNLLGRHAYGILLVFLRGALPALEYDIGQLLVAGGLYVLISHDSRSHCRTFSLRPVARHAFGFVNGCPVLSQSQRKRTQRQNCCSARQHPFHKKPPVVFYACMAMPMPYA